MSQPPRILFVDDEELVLRGLRTVLGRNRKLWAMDFDEKPKEALARLERQPYDVVVTDMVMPEMDGAEFLARVRAISPGTARIVLSGYANEPTMMRTLPLAHHVLAKPCVPELLELAIERSLALQASLAQGFGRALGAAWLAWQPIVSARDRTLYAYEALLRSREPSLANPSLLLEAAEQLGRLDQVGAAVRALAAEPSTPHHRFINLHPRDLLDDALYDPQSPLARIADRVVLEITERASLEQVTDLDGRLARLRAAGYRFAVDDLGEGYAGLTTFARFAPEVAKIDLVLVRGIDTSAVKRQIVRSIIALCRELGVTIVAEGVETTAERDVLIELGVDLLQGYLFARPGPAFPAWTWP